MYTREHDRRPEALVHLTIEYTGRLSSALCQPITDELVSKLSAIPSCFPYLMMSIADTATRTNTAALVSLVRLSCHRSLRAQRQDIGWAADPPASTIQGMGVDHCGSDVLMSAQFLHCANVIAAFEHMGANECRKVLFRGT